MSMYIIKGLDRNTKATRAERIVKDISEDVMSWIDTLKSMNMQVLINKLDIQDQSEYAKKILEHNRNSLTTGIRLQ